MSRVLRAEPAVFGLVASDPTVSRTIDRLAHDATAALAAIDTARAAARARAWALAGDHAPDYSIDAGRPLVIDVDATLVTAHSDKEGAAPTFKKGFGHHPLWAFVDHGPDGTGEPLAALLRPGNAGSNTAADHLTVIRAALRQLPGHRAGHRPGRKILVRVDGAGATHELLDWLHTQRLSYSVGFGLTQPLVDQLAALPAGDWQTAYNADGEPRPGAWVIEATGLMSLRGLAGGDAGDRPQGATAPRRAAAADRPRRAPLHRLRHQHPPRRPAPPTRRPRTAPPPPRPSRGPHPRREGHRAAQPARCTSWTRTGSGRPSSRWPARSPPGPNCSPSPSTPHGGGNPNGSGSGSSPCPPRPPVTPAASCCTCPPTHPGPGLALDGLDRLRALAVPG